MEKLDIFDFEDDPRFANQCELRRVCDPDKKFPDKDKKEIVNSLVQKDIFPRVLDKGGINGDVIDSMMKNGGKKDDIERLADLAVNKGSNKLYADYIDKSRKLYAAKGAKRSVDTDNNDNSAEKTFSTGKNIMK
ncbi:MAG: hypothetical protein IJM75_04950 [Ruminococcus sp.]|nr:hypothetical protein [Ruminococcus sp.]